MHSNYPLVPKYATQNFVARVTFQITGDSGNVAIPGYLTKLDVSSGAVFRSFTFFEQPTYSTQMFRTLQQGVTYEGGALTLSGYVSSATELLYALRMPVVPLNSSVTYLYSPKTFDILISKKPIPGITGDALEEVIKFRRCLPRGSSIDITPTGVVSMPRPAILGGSGTFASVTLRFIFGYAALPGDFRWDTDVLVH